MVPVASTAPDGIAASLDIVAGDRIVSIDGEPVRDFLDVVVAERAADLSLIVEKQDGELWQLEIEKEAGEPFGLVLEHPDPDHCGNNCLFCFVHQLPKGLRRTLYVKDEDYRFSYLYGAYITLSNLGDADLERIVRQHLSPLYVSVHAVDEGVRSRLLGRQAPPILPLLRHLVDSGIELHTQVVVCPGINDGEDLDVTVSKLYALHPGVRSLALVPVGLTRHRSGLPGLTSFGVEDARKVLAKIAGWQERFLEIGGSRFVFAADEFYLRAGAAIPDVGAYEDLSQIENGVGMIALFRDEAEAVYEEVSGMDLPVAFTVVTGTAFEQELGRYLSRVAELTGCRPLLYSIENRLFGESVTVAGLVSGDDIAARLSGKKLGAALLVPDVMLKDGADRFLDDLTTGQLQEMLGCRVMVIPSTPWGILEAIEELSGTAAGSE